MPAADAIENVAAVAPARSVPFFRHWYASGAVPVAVTENWTAVVLHAVTPAGCAVIAGAVSSVSVAAALVTDPHPFVTTTS